MIESSARCYLMVDHQKFDRTALYLLAHLDVFDGIITSTELAKDRADALREVGIPLHFAATD